MDEAMWQAYSEYELADWRSCPEDVDPVATLVDHRPEGFAEPGTAVAPYALDPANARRLWALSLATVS
jgi:hypothetical protein